MKVPKRLDMNEMNKLVKLLAKNDIPFEIIAFHVAPATDEHGQELSDVTWQVVSPSKADQRIDAVCHAYSYGGRSGLIEIMADHLEDVVGWLTAEEALGFFREELSK